MIVTILIILTNIMFTLYLSSKKKKYKDDYEKEKDYFVTKKIYKMIKCINICKLLVYALYITITLLSKYTAIIHIILGVLELLTFAFFLTNSNKVNKRLKIIDKKLFNNGDILFILGLTIISITENLNYNGIHNYLFEVINMILLLISLIILLSSLLSYKGYICYTAKEKDYLEDIKFATKIQINKIVNYFVYIVVYILFILVGIYYIYILYIVIALALLLIIKNKIEKIGQESNRLYQTITIANEMPGVYYAYYFLKDIYLIRKLIIIFVLVVASTLSYYFMGEGELCYIAFAIYNLLLYVILYDKYRMIKYTSSLNDKLIDKKKYSILQTKNISYIDTIKIFNTKLYRLIVVDTIVYESNLILYDPEILINDIDIRINKSNIEDYIFIERYLYNDPSDDIDEEEEEDTE